MATLQTVGQQRCAFYAHELDVSRLNKIHKHLWLAGLERPARPLHRQVAIGRDIIVTEEADLHLLWTENRIYVKPLPDFLLSRAAWQEMIDYQPDRLDKRSQPNDTATTLHEKASGLLLSYLWLIEYRSDLKLAKDKGLIHESIDWEKWTKFSRSVANNLDFRDLNGINIRYRHGEMRLSRINWIYRFCSQTRSVTNVMRGYLFGYYHYDSFISAHLAWLTSTVVYIALALTAMQVGLVTDELKGSKAFGRASYGLTVFSIIAPIAIICIVMMTAVVLVTYNAAYTMSRRKDWTEIRAEPHTHQLSRIDEKKGRKRGRNGIGQQRLDPV